MKDQLRKGKSKGPSESYTKFRVRWRHVLLIDQQVRAGRAPNFKFRLYRSRILNARS